MDSSDHSMFRVFYCTDSFGMMVSIQQRYMYQITIPSYRQGMDVPDIKVEVVQWKATGDLCTLWEWFGRAAP